MTLPNKLTLGRILCLPFILVMYYSSNLKVFVTAYILGWIFGFTDYLDGYLARRLKQVSILGKILDPIADKLFVLLICLFFVDVGMLPVWVLLLLMIREFVISDFRLLAIHQGQEVAVSKIGKWKATFQYILIANLGYLRILYLKGIPNDTFHFRGVLAGYYLFLCLTIAFTLFSLCEYFWSNRRVIQYSQ